MNTQLNWKQTLASLLIGGALVLTGWATSLLTPKEPPKGLGNVSNSFGTAIDVVGTNVGTTTTGVNFYARSASTTYPFPLRDNESNVVITLKSLATSTPSGGFAGFSILASNDNDCATASTTYSAVQNNTVVSDIQWSDAASYVKNAASLTSLSTATTTFGFPNASSVRLERTLVLTDVNARCLALEVAASSTALQVSAMAR